MATLALLIGLATLASSAATIAAATSVSTNTITATPSLSAVSYSYTFTVTTSTTVWSAPSFATDSPIPACSDTMCPALNGKYCVDAGGDKYGILCNIQFSGMVITNSGKKLLMERIPGEADGPMSDIAKRTYAGSFDNCAEFCDEYDDPSAPCMDVAYHDGYCKSYGTITGTFSLAGGIAAVR
ncbi:hypothetical protein LTR33_001578 [Friedmanniomyces endolithicus]|nr:hypothetical protein LTR33_001578 [Friedmanniomyces endolithicus]